MKYVLLAYLKNEHTESYYSNDFKGLVKYAEFRKFDNFRLFGLRGENKWEKEQKKRRVSK